MRRLGHAFFIGLLATACGGQPGFDEATGAAWPVQGIAEGYGKLRLLDDAGTLYVVAMGDNGGRPIGSIAHRVVFRPDLADTAQDVVSGMVEGEVYEYRTMTARMTYDDGVALAAQVTFDPLYHRDGRLSRLRGQWPELHSTLFILYGSTLFARSSGGSVYDGRATSSDSNHNVYWLDITLTGCGNRSGNWGGLGWTADETAEGDDRLFYLMVSKPDLAELIVLTKI